MQSNNGNVREFDGSRTFLKSDLEYLRMGKLTRLLYSIGHFFYVIPGALGRFFTKFGKAIANFFVKFGLACRDIWYTFIYGDWKTKVSFFVMGFGSTLRGQWLRGILFFLFEVVFILYMVLIGGPNLAQLGSLGDKAMERNVTTVVIDGVSIEIETVTYYDNSFNILLYGVLTLFFIVAFCFTWYINVKQNKISEEILAEGKKLKSTKDDVNSLLDEQFSKTLLALPLAGILIFTVLPIFFMILIAFTNYDNAHTPPNNLFDWVGFENFSQIFYVSNGSSTFGFTFGQILLWTLVWAFFATFSNYFLGMLVAMAINKKGIKGKKIFRGILVLTIAIPQFISLLFVSQAFSTNGIINHCLTEWGWISQPIDFWGNTTLARVTVILINVWIGVPYLMLMISGVLMNIPADLYESSKIDGASFIQQYFKITLPYTMFVTGPYLLTSFVGNMNNFNVIYLLTGGAPANDMRLTSSGAGGTDLLITWLFKLTVDQQNYKMAAVIGILVFVVVAVLSLIVYNLIPSTRNEEDYQ